MTGRNLCNRTNVAPNTLSRFESENTIPIAATITVLQAALEAAGVIFVEENGEGLGVRLKKGR
jgi:transcriptional regulator with XRE-family HTH domain